MTQRRARINGKYFAVGASLLAASLLLAASAAPLLGAPQTFTEWESPTKGDLALVFLRAGGSPDELKRLCDAGLCQMQSPPLKAKPPKPKAKATAAKTVSASATSKLEMLKKLRAKVSKALKNLQSDEAPRGRLLSVGKIGEGYVLRYQGGQREVVPPHQSKVSWIGLARDADRRLVAAKAVLEDGRRVRLARRGERFAPVTCLQGVVDRGSFSTAWLRAGGAPHLVTPLQEALPAVNLSRIQRGFGFEVLMGPFDEGGRTGMLAVSLLNPQLNDDGVSFTFTRHRAVKVGGRFTRPGASRNYVSENWPLPNASLQVLDDSLVFTSSRAMRPQKRVQALMRGRVGVVNREWWLMSVDYDNGFSLLYDGVVTSLKPGDEVGASDPIGAAPYGNLVVRARPGASPTWLRANPLAFRRAYDYKPGQNLRAIFEKATAQPDKAHTYQARLWDFLLDFLANEAFPKS